MCVWPATPQNIMAEETWHYLENQFDNTTKTSQKRMHAQALFHGNALANAPAGIVNALNGRLLSARTPYDTKYALWQNFRGQLKGATQSQDESFAALSGDDIESIETDFKVAYKRGTPEHTSAFPQGREPFQSGSQDARKTALDALLTRIGQLIAPLNGAVTTLVNNGAPQPEIDAAQRRAGSMAAAQTTATARKTAIETARVLQDGLESNVALASDALEVLRVELATALYGNMLQLALELVAPATRGQVMAFFDLELLQHHEPDEEEPPVVPPPPGP